MLAFSLATSPVVGEMKEEYSVYSLVEGPGQKKTIIGLTFKNVLYFVYGLGCADKDDMCLSLTA